MISAYNKSKRIWEKHSEELNALLTGGFPKFITSNNSNILLPDIPIFVFHEVEPTTFENQLIYLSENGYRSISSEELSTFTKYNNATGNEIVLTFDDATSSFWSYAYPLLKKYNHKAIVFAIPGLTPEDPIIYPNLNDYWTNISSLDDIEKRIKTQPLCTWNEIEEMSRSDFIDVQCHSLTHARINTSTKLVDFIHPNFDTYFYENITIPISVHDDPARPLRKVEFGAPIFENFTRMKCINRFYENDLLLKYMQDFIEYNGGAGLFNKKKWRLTLKNHFNKWDKNKLGHFEEETEMINAVSYELRESKIILEERLNKRISHFCYPWYESSLKSDELAKNEGYDNLYYSMKIPNNNNSRLNRVSRHARISEQYLFRLPGKGRRSFSSIWLDKVRVFMGN